MMRPAFLTPCLLAVSIFLVPAAQAASRSLKAGENLPVSEDLVLAGDDVLEIAGTPEKRCRIDANGHTIRTRGKWTGRVRIVHCDFRGLGNARSPALDLVAGGSGEQIVIEDCDFHACGAVWIDNAEQSATSFCRNRLLASSMVPVTNLPSESPPIFRARGNSPARKRFQGNQVARSVILFENSRNWLIGGNRDGESNLIFGMRGSLSIHTCADMSVRLNYLHTEIPSFRWSQVHTISVQAPCPNLVIEHNVIRHGQWVVRGLQGEFRYNLVLDADGHNFIIGPRSGTHIHHNIFARYCTIDPNLNATIGVVYKADDIQIYNNTFDGGGKDLARPWHVPAIEVSPEAFLHSLRNNIFFNHPTRFQSGSALIRPGFSEKNTDPAPARLGFADYNLFFNSDAAGKKNYALRVQGKTEGADEGFAKHDRSADPRFTGPVPKKFPFADADILARKVRVSEVLAFYRRAYLPTPKSPAFAVEGGKSFVGAIGFGKNAPNDQFGLPPVSPAPARAP